MRHRARPMVLAALATFAGHATAAEYFPPDGTGWWQLQSTDGSYTEVCAQFAGPCDPAPGVYTLIDHDNGTRDRVTISGDDSGPGAASFTRETHTESYSELQGNGYYEATASCPTGVLVGVLECRAAGLGVGVDDWYPTSTRVDGERATCTTRQGWADRQEVTNVSIAISCANDG